MKGKWISVVLAVALVALAVPSIIAAPEAPLGAIPLASAYSQSFDTLATSGTTNIWTDDTTLNGWYSNRTTYIADAGTSNTGGLHSYGTGTETERALGSLGSNAAPSVYYGARFTNDTGKEVTSIQVGYTGEQWRNGGNTTQHALVFGYQIGATDIINGMWTPVTALDFTGPIATGTAAALDGNASANRVVITPVTINLSLASGQEVWLRWFDTNDVGNDHGLAIDDLTVTAQGTLAVTLRTLTARVPLTPLAALPAAALALAGGAFVWRRRREA